MVDRADIEWFKNSFWHEMKAATSGTAFDPDMLVAIACQETGALWAPMRAKGLAKDEIVRLCCGDTLDEDKGRRAFPLNRAALEAHPRGAEMFGIARKALLEMAEHVPGYGFAKEREHKFCHGFGVFQYDIQHFRTDPGYFLERRFERFADTLDRAMTVLHAALRARELEGMAEISDFAFLMVAITYNTGTFQPNRGLRQGHFDGEKFYGEHVNDYLAMARTIPAPDGTPPVIVQRRDTAVIVTEDQPMATGPRLRVRTMLTSLRLRRAPTREGSVTQNVIAELPDGALLRAFGEAAVDGFRKVEAVLDGRSFVGYALEEFLVDETGTAPPEALPEPLATSPHPAVRMPRKAGTLTRRTEIAGAHSLMEEDMPGRTGDTPQALRDSIARIIGYLDPGRQAHRRYWPRDGLTFCNIYAHDFCALAGAYLPRVWWTDRALARHLAGDTVEPLYGDTIREMRANDLFRWLRDYGPAHGWERALDATELQNNANRGAVCLIIARRKQDGKSGHVSIVVPETRAHTAKRLPGGEVSSPLQSQAGSGNFNYGTGRPNWWRGTQFAEFAFWFAR